MVLLMVGKLERLRVALKVVLLVDSLVLNLVD